MKRSAKAATDERWPRAGAIRGPGSSAVTASVEAEDARGWSNLLIAAEKGDAEAVRAELAAGADINQADEDGWSALHLAAHNARIAVLETEDADAYRGGKVVGDEQPVRHRLQL